MQSCLVGRLLGRCAQTQKHREWSKDNQLHAYILYHDLETNQARWIGSEISHNSSPHCLPCLWTGSHLSALESPINSNKTSDLSLPSACIAGYQGSLHHAQEPEEPPPGGDKTSQCCKIMEALQHWFTELLLIVKYERNHPKGDINILVVSKPHTNKAQRSWTFILKEKQKERNKELKVLLIYYSPSRVIGLGFLYWVTGFSFGWIPPLAR